AVLYVLLEPCAHHGKTPPCADLIIRHNIRKVIIGCRDPFVEVNGKGIEKLLAAGIVTETGVLEAVCKDLNKRFFTFHTQHRPYIILKWAQTGDGKIGNYDNNRLHITGSTTNRLVHKWRSEEAAILIGTNTAEMDNPQLTNRLWTGPSPTRVVVDMDLRLPPSLHIFDGRTPSIIFNTKMHGQQNNNLYYQIMRDNSVAHQIMHALYQLKILSVLIEGGAQLLQSFIEDGYWDEARVITNHSIILHNGISAPALSNEKFIKEELIENDLLRYYVRT
ncbi:MAG: bifunctional diaminohydroxyphosphoribosylaminopyrimidine deaminase/5-amino-6-(5-phosphoribosylamino)uracil reductase RibD, partial [Chitinophagaceae bacterium]|nr:bifunctional diaminohydroxyphosphoribosylaminopyrimidine deaminase/5-amino-6-(5-phosphoribosylamino)uracil reductase RibD [Chitinophagaceae bacterium]